jgi:serine/threonine-protein kinase
MLAAQAGRVVPLDPLRPGADPSFVAAIDRALAVDPERRFSSADEMATALRGLDDQTIDTAVMAPLMNDDDTAVLPARDDSRTRVLPIADSPPATTPMSTAAPEASRARRSTRRITPAAAVFALVGLIVAAAIVFALVIGSSDKGASPANLRATPTVVIPAPVQRALDRLTQAVKG